MWGCSECYCSFVHESPRLETSGQQQVTESRKTLPQMQPWVQKLGLLFFLNWECTRIKSCYWVFKTMFLLPSEFMEGCLNISLTVRKIDPLLLYWPVVSDEEEWVWYSPGVPKSLKVVSLKFEWDFFHLVLWIYSSAMIKVHLEKIGDKMLVTLQEELWQVFIQHFPLLDFPGLFPNGEDSTND